MTEHYLKYLNLYNYHNISLNISFCLSEFIDNSISSCDITFWKNGIDHKLIINIEYDEHKKTYTIIDNAGGMTQCDLDHAMLIEKNKQTNTDFYDNTNKNQYGLGMKSAIFWLGKDAWIYSKKEGHTIKGDYFARRSKDDDRVSHEVVAIQDDVIKSDSGTKIIVYDTYKNTRTLTDDRLDEVCEFIGARYSGYLDDNSKNKCSIRISTNWHNGGIFKSKEVKKITLKDNKNVSVFKYDPIICNKSKEDVELKIKKYSESLDKYQDTRDEFLLKLLNSEELVFDDYIKIGNFAGDKEYKSKVKVYILNEPNKLYAGIWIIHSNRYITHPVSKKAIKDKLGGTYVPFNEKDFDQRWKWIRVDINLTDIESNEKCEKIYPDQNKTKIIFDEQYDIIEYNKNNEKNSFYGAFKELYKKWRVFADIVKDIKTQKDETNADNLENISISVYSNKESGKLDLPLKQYFNANENVTAEVEIICAGENVLLVDENDFIDENGKKIYKYKYNQNNKYFSKFKSDNDMSYIIKLLLYLDMYCKKSSSNNEGISQVINDALEFWSKEK